MPGIKHILTMALIAAVVVALVFRVSAAQTAVTGRAVGAA